MWEILLVVLSANAIWEFARFLIVRHDEKRESPERKMLRALGSDKLYELLTKWKHADERPASEWEVIENLYDGYTALKGNGEIRKLYNECKEIETTD